MTHSRVAVLCALVAALAVTGAFAADGSPNPERPPLAHTGGFGEPTCHACHFGSALNAGMGILALTGLPERGKPGSTHRITIRLAQEDMLRAGFMLSARTTDGAQAGTLRATDTRATVTRADDVAYAHHTLAGTEVTGNSAEWTLEWVADSVTAGDTVLFHVSANAGNDDASPFGDYIYATRGELRVK